jgi:hypothetical protein
MENKRRRKSRQARRGVYTPEVAALLERLSNDRREEFLHGASNRQAATLADGNRPAFSPPDLSLRA